MTDSDRVLLEQMQGYLQHKPNCQLARQTPLEAQVFIEKHGAVCTCGLAALLRALPQTPEPTEEKTMDKPLLTGLWRNDPATPEGKYLVKRRDGTVVEWPNFVIGAKDPAAPAALRAYADAAERCGMSAGFIRDVRALAEEFEQYRHTHGAGDPDRGRHREDDPATIAEMRHGHSA